MSLDPLFRHITHPIVCAKCEAEQLEGRSDAASLRDYGALEAGFTARGLQIWCRRHDLNVCHIDFEGRRLEADFRCLEKKSGAH
jgi:hypothetical protein